MVVSKTEVNTPRTMTFLKIFHWKEVVRSHGDTLLVVMVAIEEETRNVEVGEEEVDKINLGVKGQHHGALEEALGMKVQCLGVK